jgi:hypothetical protein
MSNIDEKLEDEVDDILSPEEHQIIETIQKVSFVKPFNPVEEVKVEVEVKPWSIWSIFNNPANIVGALGGAGTRHIAPFDLTRRVGLNKVVTINNISGKNAYVILSPAPIKTIDSGGLGVKDISLIHSLVVNSPKLTLNRSNVLGMISIYIKRFKRYIIKRN